MSKIKYTIEADISDLPALTKGSGLDFNTRMYVKMALANYRNTIIEQLKQNKYKDAALREVYEEQAKFGQRLAESIK